MNIHTERLALSTRGNNDIVDITADVQDLLSRSGFAHGQAVVFVQGSTGGVTTLEFEPGLLKDLPEAFEKIAPMNAAYHHDMTWHDGNGFSHVRSALTGPSLTVPFENGRLLLGTWQQIIFIDFDNRPRGRELIVQFTGE
jgi:secondary thiamine-phosphate synthase enzyme